MAVSPRLRQRPKRAKLRCNRHIFQIFVLGLIVTSLVVFNLYWLTYFSSLQTIPKQHHHLTTFDAPRNEVMKTLERPSSEIQKANQPIQRQAERKEKVSFEIPKVRNNNHTNKSIKDLFLLRRQQKKKTKIKRPPIPEPRFKFRRSNYTPPDDYIEKEFETVPINYWQDHLQQASKSPQALNFTRSIQYLGILIDAGRHYFEMEFLFQIIDLLQLLQFNWIHFRLTDDQAFNVKLESWPQLAIPSPYANPEQKVYTPQQLRELVKYAKDRNITIIPEINVPGHAGAWGVGIPDLVVPCSNHICKQGYGVPLNITHHLLPQILKDVLKEVIDIFDDPPYLHLGGDEIEMSKPCYKEINHPFPNYNKFEALLKQTLKEISYNESKVIRWEMTMAAANPKGRNRAGGILHWWFQIPGEKRQIPTKPDEPFLASSGLYFDFNEDDSAWEVFLHTRKFLFLNFDYHPMGLVVGTFELDPEFWYHRNVLGKLIAVAMGASKEVEATNGTVLYKEYRHYCDKLGFPNATCRKYGKPNLSWKAWKNPKWEKIMWKQFKDVLCERLTMTVNSTKV